jgi:hypothetical protein
MNTIQLPTISYMEVRNSNNELLDKLYIGSCDYDINPDENFCFKNLIYEQKNIKYNVSDDSDPNKLNTIVSVIELDKYYINKIEKSVEAFNPQILEEDSALYDMKLALYWIEEKKQEFANRSIKFLFVTYQAILENIEYM